jgi:hypothetical protein
MSPARPGCSLRDFRLIVSTLLFTLLALPFNLQAQAEKLAATYREGKLSVTIPYDSSQVGSGKLTVEVLDPDDHALGRVERVADIRNGSGSFQQTVTLTEPIAFEEILWQRLRYRFEYDHSASPDIEGIESISQIIRRPVVRILGDKEYIVGSQAAIRVIVSEANSNLAQTGSLHIELLVPDKDARQLFSGPLNPRGTVEANFRFPAGLTGNYQLRFIADTPIGSAEYTQPIEIADKASILLTTEKPIYQPGQTIHVRAGSRSRGQPRGCQSQAHI